MAECETGGEANQRPVIGVSPDCVSRSHRPAKSRPPQLILRNWGEGIESHFVSVSDLRLPNIHKLSHNLGVIPWMQPLHFLQM